MRVVTTCSENGPRRLLAFYPHPFPPSLPPSLPLSLLTTLGPPLLHRDHAAGLLDTLNHSLVVKRPEGTQIDDLSRDTWGGREGGREGGRVSGGGLLDTLNHGLVVQRTKRTQTNNPSGDTYEGGREGGRMCVRVCRSRMRADLFPVPTLPPSCLTLLLQHLGGLQRIAHHPREGDDRNIRPSALDLGREEGGREGGREGGV